MSLRLIADESAGEIRACLLEDDQPLEIHLARGDAGQTGALRRARVTRLAPEADAAFLDLGDGLEGFLPRKYAAQPKARTIGDAVTEGHMLCVEQVLPPAEPGKGWLVRADLRYRGRYVTLDPASSHIRFAPALTDDATCRRLEEALSPIAEQCGVLVHAPAAATGNDPVLMEAAHLLDQRKAIAATDGGPRMIRPAPGLLEQVMRDAPSSLAHIDIADSALLAHARKLCRRWPDLAGLPVLWTGDEPLFAALGIEDILNQLVSGIISLPSGGAILVDETRAATVIDVNSGSVASPRMAAVAHKQANEDAARAIPQLLRLANIGGLVMVDFIDMNKATDRAALLERLDRGLAVDPAPTRHSGLDVHSVLSITRRRRGPSLLSQIRAYRTPVPHLDQTGHDLLRHAEREALKDPRPGALCLVLGPRLAHWLEQDKRLQHLQERTGRIVRLEVIADGRDTDPTCHIAP